MIRYFTVNGTLTNELGSAFKAVYSSGDVIVYVKHDKIWVDKYSRTMGSTSRKSGRTKTNSITWEG